MARRERFPRPVSGTAIEETSIEFDGHRYRLSRDGGTLRVEGHEVAASVTRFARPTGSGATIFLGPGGDAYLDARHPDTSDADLVAGVIVAGIVGHPDADEARAGTEMDILWNQHLAVVFGDDPRQISDIYGRTKVARLSGRLQYVVARGVVRVD
jgi:hypothetical protein